MEDDDELYINVKSGRVYLPIHPETHVDRFVTFKNNVTDNITRNPITKSFIEREHIFELCFSLTIIVAIFKLLFN